MKLNFRDLKQEKFVIEAESTETIAQLKEKVQAEKGWDAASQKLIYSGKILQDQNTVESYKIEEKGFIVCMIQRPKPAAAAAAASSSSATPATPAAKSVATPAPPPAPIGASSGTAAAPAVPATPTPAPSTQAAASTPSRSFNDPNVFVTGPEHQAAISNMENMGFARADIDRAMRAAYNNPDRAVEYLLTGVPDVPAPQPARAAATEGTPAAQSAPAAGAPAATTEAGGDEPFNMFEAASRLGSGAPGGAAAATRGGGAAAAADDEDEGHLQFLRNNPQFQQLRQLVQQQPQMLQSILEQLNQANPQLAREIVEHPEEFMELLAGDEESDAPVPPGATSVPVTPEERDAIERLTRLGFSLERALQAYFACDKNEELAANFLFDQPEDEDD